MTRAKYWIFTLNNYTPQEEEYLAALVSDAETPIAYLCYGREVGEVGTPHLQGHVECSSRLTLAQARRVLPRCHLEGRKGTFEQAEDYCRKDGDAVSFGERVSSGRGARTDLAALHASIKNGRSFRELADDHFSSVLKYHRGIDRIRNAIFVRRDYPPSVVVYVGPTGVGKTRSVWDNLPSPEALWQYPGKSWFDGYDNHPIALFDDFSGSELPITMLLKVLDRYPFKVPVKGGFAWWTPQEIYITTNLPVHAWYPTATPAHRAALKRRITFQYTFE